MAAGIAFRLRLALLRVVRPFSRRIKRRLDALAQREKASLCQNKLVMVWLVPLLSLLLAELLVCSVVAQPLPERRRLALRFSRQQLLLRLLLVVEQQ